MSNELTSDVPIKRVTLSHDSKIKLMEDNLEESSIGFLVGSDGYPLVVRERSSIFFGRFEKINQTDSLQIDLTEHGAAEAGVSRRHLEILKINDDFYVTDLSSTNGTQLNEKRLSAFTNHKLVSKDILRLGNLQVIVVLPRSQSESEPQEVLFSHPAAESLSFEFYRARVLKLLDFLEMLDKKIAESEKGKQGEIEMNSLSVDSERITLSLSGGRKSLQYIKTILDPFQNAHPQSITKGIDDNLKLHEESFKRFVLKQSLHAKIPALPIDDAIEIAKAYYQLGVNLSTSTLVP